MSESYKMQPPPSPHIAKEMGEGIVTERSSTDSLNTNDMLTMPLKPANGKMTWAERWEDSQGMALVLFSETFGTGMAATARLLEQGVSGMTSLQVCSSCIFFNVRHAYLISIDHLCKVYHHIRAQHVIHVLHLRPRFSAWKERSTWVVSSARTGRICWRLLFLLYVSNLPSLF